jgi:hypothetical protein
MQIDEANEILSGYGRALKFKQTKDAFNQKRGCTLAGLIMPFKICFNFFPSSLSPICKEAVQGRYKNMVTQRINFYFFNTLSFMIFNLYC